MTAYGGGAGGGSNNSNTQVQEGGGGGGWLGAGNLNGTGAMQAGEGYDATSSGGWGKREPVEPGFMTAGTYGGAGGGANNVLQAPHALYGGGGGAGHPGSGSVLQKGGLSRFGGKGGDCVPGPGSGNGNPGAVPGGGGSGCDRSSSPISPGAGGAGKCIIFIS